MQEPDLCRGFCPRRLPGPMVSRTGIVGLRSPTGGKAKTSGCAGSSLTIATACRGIVTPMSRSTRWSTSARRGGLGPDWPDIFRQVKRAGKGPPLAFAQHARDLLEHTGRSSIMSMSPLSAKPPKSARIDARRAHASPRACGWTLVGLFKATTTMLGLTGRGERITHRRSQAYAPRSERHEAFPHLCHVREKLHVFHSLVCMLGAPVPQSLRLVQSGPAVRWSWP